MRKLKRHKAATQPTGGAPQAKATTANESDSDDDIPNEASDSIVSVDCFELCCDAMLDR